MKIAKITTLIAMAISLSACGSTIKNARNTQLRSVSATQAETGQEACAMSTALGILQQARKSSPYPLTVAIGDMSDLTGKSNLDEGHKLTQGLAEMTATSLGYFSRGGGIKFVERSDVKVLDRELALSDRNALKTTGVFFPKVAVTPANYYVTGAITELNYDVSSSGAKLRTRSVTLTNRQSVASVAIDLRLVNTATLEVYETSSMRMQVQLNENDAQAINGGTVIRLGNQGQAELQRAIRKMVNISISGMLIHDGNMLKNKCR